MFYSKLEQLCKKNNLKITNFVQIIGMGNGNVTRWKHGAIPNSEHLKKIADYFHVSTDYLLNEDEELQNNDSEFSIIEREIISLYRKDFGVEKLGEQQRPNVRDDYNLLKSFHMLNNEGRESAITHVIACTLNKKYLTKEAAKQIQI